ncbi:MAG: hypothetical protein M1832_006334 [Thelocarpon impressellum]|nr:MAG: hypothetical protein M1832_006334 [Thelocarpon impressellum]
MALARAFTSRKTKRPEISLPAPPNRSTSTRNFSVQRAKISGPTELLSTTNMLSFNAPDIRSTSPSSSSGDDSESTPADYQSPTTSVDSSSVGSRPGSPEPNHLSCYFNPAKSADSPTPSRASSSSTEDVPRVPQRALTHTAATHKALARKRSQQRMAAPPNAIHNVQARSSAGMFGAHGDDAAAASAHPFGRELAQVNELAEEYGVSGGVADEEERLLAQKGLLKFGAADYLAEIQALCGGGVFEDMLLPSGAGWI